MPERPDVVVEDCTMISPQCAMKGGNYGFHTYMRIQANRCRFITLNFSQPAGTPTDGVVQSVQNGKYLHVDFQDCTLMGYKIFGVKVDKDSAQDIGFTAKGAVNAYVQWTQEVPQGMHRLVSWPVEVFDQVSLPAVADPRPPLQEETLILRDACEVSPLVWKERLCLFVCHRPASGGTKEDYYLTISDVETGEELARFGNGYSLASAVVLSGTLYVSASRFEENNWNDVTLFTSTDLQTWTQKVAVTQEPNEHLFNSSICQGPDGYVMAYESNDPAYPAFTIKFAQSQDLETWTKLPDATFGTDRYTACPTIRYANGYYYVFYLEQRTPRWFFETYVTRSADLKVWYRSPLNPVLSPQQIDDGINASDPDLVEFQGKTYLYYAVGDQLTWMNIKRATYPVPLADFLNAWFPERRDSRRGRCGRISCACGDRGQGQAAGVVPQRQVRHVRALGAVRGAQQRPQRQVRLFRHQGESGVERRVRDVRQAVSWQVLRCGQMDGDRQGCRREVRRADVETSRRLRTLRQPGDDV